MNEGVTGGEEVAQSVPEIPAPISDKMMYDELMANDPYFKQNEMLQHTLGKIFTPELLDVRIREEVVQKHRLELQMRYDYYLRNKDLADYAQGGVNQNLSPAALEDLKPSAEQVIEAKAAVDQQKAAAVEAPLQAAHVTTQEPELAAPSEPAQQSVPEVVASPVAEPLVRQEIHKSGVKAKGVETTSDDGYMFQVLFTSDPGFVNNVELMKELSVLVDPNLAREAPEAAILEARRKLTEYYQKFIGVRPTAAPMPQEPAKQPASEFPKPAPEKPRNSAENKQKLNDFSLAEKQSEAKSYYIVLGVKNDHTFSLATLQSKYRALQKKLHPDYIKLVDPTLETRAKEATARVNVAYEVLSDPEKKKKYDQDMKNPLRASGEKVTTPEEALRQKMYDIFNGRGSWDDFFVNQTSSASEVRMRSYEKELENAPNCRRIRDVLQKMSALNAVLKVWVDDREVALSPNELMGRVNRVLENRKQPPAVIDPLVRELPTQFQLRGRVYREAMGRNRAFELLSTEGITLAKIEEALSIFASYEMTGRLADGKTMIELAELFKLIKEIRRKLPNTNNARVRAELSVEIQQLSSWSNLDIKVLWCLNGKIQCPPNLKLRYDQMVKNMQNS